MSRDSQVKTDTIYKQWTKHFVYDNDAILIVIRLILFLYFLSEEVLSNFRQLTYINQTQVIEILYFTRVKIKKKKS